MDTSEGYRTDPIILDRMEFPTTQMAMATRTQLQTHFSRLRDLASQPAQPLKPTFWDNLDLDRRKASVDQERSREFKDGSAWDSTGPVKDEWNDSIYPRAIRPLLQDNTRKIYHGVKRQTPFSVCCWMVGREWHSSHPAAIIICGNKKVTNNAVKLIEQHAELARTWGFRVYGFESKVLLTMGNATDDIEDETPLCAFSGTRFAVGDRNQISTRMATLGGSIMLGGEFFGVTVAHPFIEHLYDEFSDEEESDMSDDDSDVTSIISCPESAQPVMLESDIAYVEDSPSHRERILGYIPEESRPNYFSQSTDWALLKLRETSLAINFMILKDRLVVPWRISKSFPEGELWAVVDSAKPISTKVSPSVCGLFIPHAGLQDVWAMDMKPSKFSFLCIPQ